MANLRSLPSRGAWIEMSRLLVGSGMAGSLPSRGAWIEIGMTRWKRLRCPVAPLAGSVDRNAAKL